jgi:ABC-type multidrug transport system fused ATPase/permease subunit
MNFIEKLWFILGPRQRIEAGLLLCGMAVGAVFEAVSIGLFVPFIAVLKQPELVLELQAARPLLTYFDIHAPRQVVVLVGLGLVAVFLVRSGYLVLLYRWLFRFVFEAQIRLARQLLTGYLHAPYTYHLQRNSAEMIKTLTGTVQSFSAGFLVGLLTVLAELLVVVALIVLLLVIAPYVTIGAVVVLAVPAAASYFSMRRRLASSGQISEKSLASVIQWAEQAIGGIKETRIMGRASFFIDRHGYYFRRFVESQRSLMFLSTIPRLLIDTLAVSAMVAIALVVLVRGQDLETLLPVLGTFAVAAIRLMPSISRIATGLAQLRFLTAAVQVLHDELRAIEPDDPARADPAAVPRTSANSRFERSLVLDHVSFKYPSMQGAAIDDISLEIPRGCWVGLVGPTGAGKTTLVDLILGLLSPVSGRILVDGSDLQDDIAGWQRNIGLVPQEVFLMDDTVRRNVAFGSADQDIDDTRVWQALQAARVDKLVRGLPGGLDAIVGERGDRLSGGERQRLGIARALYRDPAVLVVDEGTANLDNETEAAIVRTLAGLRGEKTIIVVAHRLALVTQCDQVYMLRQGRIQHSGAYAELVSTEPGFRQFVGSAL